MLRMCQQHGYFRGEACPICGDEGKFLMSQDEMDSLGRVLMGILRHFPERFGLRMDEQGFIDISRLAQAIRRNNPRRFRWLRPNHIIALAETDPKGRYQIEGNAIRATYGHSIKLKDMELPTGDVPENLYYPTSEEEAELLLERGITPTDRAMVHLSKTYKNAYEAGSVKIENPIIIRVAAKKAVESGVVIYHAATTIYTTDFVPPEFLSIVKEGDEELKEMEEGEKEESE
ncbi:MAG: RNA 2'-phosphotransferase [Thermoplasmata archaeon]|nr:RNA 2'-phosphotransferase [Thermoplasmata archaeon]